MLVLFAAVAVAAPHLAITGTCPGPVTVAVTGSTPGGTLALLHDDSPGADTIPAGACAGAATELSGLLWSGHTTDGDGDGAFLFVPTLGADVCSRSVQVLDPATCTLSNRIDLSTVRPDGWGGPLVPGDTDAVVTTIGGDVFDPAAGEDSTFGELDFRCAEWDGDVCANPQVRVGDHACGAYPRANEWHRNVYVNVAEDRSCRLFCKATTGSEAWTVCEGGDPNADAQWAYSYAQAGTQCDGRHHLWRTSGITDQCGAFCLNIKLGASGLGGDYPGSPNLRLECAGW